MQVLNRPDCPGSGQNPPGLTCVLRPDRESALIGRQDLQFDHIRGVGQQLCDLHQRAVLRAGLVYGQKDVSDVQRSTPVGGGGQVRRFCFFDFFDVCASSPFCHAGRLDLVDDDDLFAPVYGGGEADPQAGGGTLHDLHQQGA